MSKTILEAGSFRDKANRVFYYKDEVYRALSMESLHNFVDALGTQFFGRMIQEGKIVGTRIAPFQDVPSVRHGHWAAILHHDRIPFISYPYEWTFSMLQDAALLHLELLRAALAEGITLKDASAYNVQWNGARAVFIDIPSFVPWRPGQPWVGYAQFCSLFLFPLLIQAHRNVPFQPWLRGSIDGISVEDCSHLLARDFYKAGVLADVMIHARLQKGFAKTPRKIQHDLADAGFHQEIIQSNIKRLTKIVKGLTWKPKTSVWTNYGQTCTYSARETADKKTFVERSAKRKKRGHVWDLGCNTGEFSKLIAPFADHVVAVDGDARVVDALYRALRGSGPYNITPLTMNITDLSPSMGWLGRERKAFVERGHPDLILCLALIHHICITANVPMNEWVGWLAGFYADLIIEFVTVEDPMVQQLLRNKDGDHGDYDRDVFEAMLHEHFEIQETLSLSSGRRILYYCEVKKS